MADARFFSSAGPYSVHDLTEKIGLKKHDSDLVLSGVASLDEAGPNEISFFSNIKLQLFLGNSETNLDGIDLYKL